VNNATGVIAPLVQAFFTDHLVRQRRASQQTVASYRDTFRLLIQHLSQATGKKPSDLNLDDLQAKAIMQFLEASNEIAVIVFKLGTRGWQQSGPFFGW
jgi:site-specific recombinase XerD